MASRVHVVPLRGTLGLRDAAGLAATLGAAIAAHGKVDIDAAELSDADFSILQVLAAAKVTADKAGCALRLRAPSDGALLRLLARAGFVGADRVPHSPAERFWTDTETKGRAA